MKIDLESRIARMDMLHPIGAAQFLKLQKLLMRAYEEKKTRTLFVPFETWRTPHRQKMLLEVAKTTKAGPWQSSHQYGLAVDFVPWVDNEWSWELTEDWDFLDQAAKGVGLSRPISWDRPHIEHPSFTRIRLALGSK